MTETEVAVIGGGASGLMASIASALAGADTINRSFYSNRAVNQGKSTAYLYTIDRSFTYNQ